MIIIAAIFGSDRKRAAPEWELGIQAFDQKFADKLPYDVLDPTKTHPEEVLPIRLLIGAWCSTAIRIIFLPRPKQVATARPTSYRCRFHQRSTLAKGGFFSYLDTPEITGWGTANFHQLPINAPKCR